MKTTSKTTRINPDSIQTLWFTVFLVGFLAVASFTVSFTGLRDVAAWAGIPQWLRWAVPVFIDVAILAYTMAVLIHRSRGEKTWPSWLSLAGFTVFSVGANAAHAISLDHPNEWQRYIGAAIAALAPVAVFAATEQLGRLVIRLPESVTPNTVDTKTAISVRYPLEIPQQSIGGESLEQEHVSVGATYFPKNKAVEDTTAKDQVKAVSPRSAPEVQPFAILPTADASVALAPELATPVLSASVSVEATAAEHETLAPSAERSPKESLEPGPVASSVAPAHIQSVPHAGNSDRPALSVVGRPTRKRSLEDWVIDLVDEGKKPTGTGAAQFLEVSERTGRTKLNELRKAKPSLFEAIPTQKVASN